MALNIVKHKPVSADRMVVTVETDLDNPSAAREELEHADARHLALQFAAKNGIISPGVDGYPEIFPVNPDGEQMEEVKPNKKTGERPDWVTGSWRAEVAVQGRPM